MKLPLQTANNYQNQQKKELRKEEATDFKRQSRMIKNQM
jgi:hypothetical protein